MRINVTSSSNNDFGATISVKVTNTGNASGSEVVQVYISLPPNGTTTPKLQLRNFAKVRDLAPGTSQVADIKLDKYAVSFWDTPRKAWRVVASRYVVLSQD